MKKDNFLDDLEMAEILANKQLVKRLKKGSRDARTAQANRRTRLIREVAKLDPQQEKALAEENLPAKNDRNSR